MSETKADNLHFVEENDPQMNWAMEKARLTLGYFRESLAAPLPLQTGFALKVRIEEEAGRSEHVWLTKVAADDDGTFVGEINNEPVYLKNLALNTRIVVEESQVSDWMILENNRLIGGYTIRASREALDLAEKEAFDAQMGFVIDLGVDYFAHDMTTPEGAILCLEDAYTAGDLDAAVACKDFRNEAHLMLDQQSDFSKEEDLLLDMTNVLELSFREHMLENGMPSFEGVLRAFPERIQVTEDAYLITEVCYHPEGRRTIDKLLVTRYEDEWRVGPPINDDDEEEEG